MIYLVVDTSEPTRLLVGLGQTSTGQRRINRSQSKFADAM